MAAKKKVKSAQRRPVNVIQIACWVTPEQRDALRELSDRTLIPQQSLLRKAIDDLLKHYTKKGA